MTTEPISTETLDELERRLERAAEVCRRNWQHQPEKLADAATFICDALAQLRAERGK